MWQGLRRRALAGIVVVAGTAALAPAAKASVSPTVSVTTSTPVAAGSTGSLGLDIRLNPSSGDAPDAVTVNLPAGVLANVSIDNGACITTAITDFSNDAACQLGSGTVTALASGVVPVPTPVVFYLTPPPAAGDLAGLAVATGAGDQIGSTDGINIRPSGSADGVGVTLDLTLPNSLDGAPVSVSEIDSTFTGVRFPATCPSTAADITLTASTYSSPSSSAPASAPLPVTGCSSLAYNPQYSLTAVKDSSDKVVKLTTTITQAPTESPDSSVSLAFPVNSLAASINALHNLCSAGVTSGTCTTVGSVTADSPDYPTALTGQAYLTGSLSGLSLTLVFPAPFPLTLVGSVNLKTNTTTFTGLPDIPLTSLAVSLNGGKQRAVRHQLRDADEHLDRHAHRSERRQDRDAELEVHDLRLRGILLLRPKRREQRTEQWIVLGWRDRDRARDDDRCARPQARPANAALQPHREQEVQAEVIHRDAPQRALLRDRQGPQAP
jgi:hypothetical protein